MAGTLIQTGQEFVINSIKTYMNFHTGSGFYVGLMTNLSDVPETAQLGSGIMEVIGCTAYSRQFSTNWVTTSGVNPYLTGSQVTFNVTGTWVDVNGYFVSKTINQNDAVWVETFPVGDQGIKYDGDIINITPKYTQKDVNS